MLHLALVLLLAAPTAEPTAEPDVPPEPVAVPWGPGEQLDFDVSFLGLPMGKARISVGDPEHGAVPVSLESHMAGLGAVISFRQTLVSRLDPVTLLPATSVLDAYEPGDYHHTDTTTFLREAGRAAIHEQGRSLSTAEVQVPPATLDFVSLVFRLRTLPLEVGRRHEFQVLAGRQVSRVVVEVVKREAVTTKVGRFQAFKVRIPTTLGGKFSEKSPTHVWFSDDPRRLVVRIAADFAIGGATATLVRYQPGS